jgi:lipoprotein-releasing system permease protein
VRTELKIAWRYLLAKKQYNAIHIISGISAAAVGVVTAAMVCVMSVMNGFGVMVEQLFSQFDPDIRIEAVSGKSFHDEGERMNALRLLPEVAMVSQSIEETALLQFEDKQMPVRLYGVDSAFATLTHIEDIITEGHYEVYDGAFDRAVLGQGLAWQMGIGARFISPLQLYAPKRHTKVNMLRPDQAFNDEVCFIAGTFAVQQTKYDNEVMLVDIGLTRRLLNYEANEVSALLLQLAPNTSPRQAEKAIQQLLGEGYKVLNRYEQQADFFRILRVEKLLTTLLLVFILLIASFNIIGSLSMLMIDKKDDVVTLRHLGASDKLIERIFLIEGSLISVVGAIIGTLLGLLLCLLQQEFGLVKMGSSSGTFIVDAYPLSVHYEDVALIFATVIVVAFLSVYYPVKYLTKRIL